MYKLGEASDTYWYFCCFRIFGSPGEMYVCHYNVNMYTYWYLYCIIAVICCHCGFWNPSARIRDSEVFRGGRNLDGIPNARHFWVESIERACYGVCLNGLEGDISTKIKKRFIDSFQLVSSRFFSKKQRYSWLMDVDWSWDEFLESKWWPTGQCVGGCDQIRTSA